MMGPAPLHDCARRLGIDPAGELAARPEGWPGCLDARRTARYSDTSSAAANRTTGALQLVDYERRFQEHFTWRPPSKCLTRAGVELDSYCIELILIELSEVATLGQVLA